MDLINKIRKLENLHIVFWLIKDTCWMMEFKWLGTLMIIPALLMAFYLVLHTRRTLDVYINAAILCWITANSYWMFVEFFFQNQYKQFALIPFGLGFIFVGMYFFKHKQSQEVKAE